mgnify:CR=1 FL=1
MESQKAEMAARVFELEKRISDSPDNPKLWVDLGNLYFDLDEHKKSIDAYRKALAINPNNPDIQPGDSFEAMKQRSTDQGYTFPYLLDVRQEVYPKFGATRTPHVFLLERSGGKYIVRYIGTIDDNYGDPDAVKTRYVENAVDALLEGRDIPMEITRAIGCSIKA